MQDCGQDRLYNAEKRLRDNVEIIVIASFDLTGKSAIVTGSSRGIGKAIAEALAAQGANVVISSRKQPACDAVAAEINARGAGRAVAISASIGSKPDLEALVRGAQEAFGAIGILVGNAATNPHFGPMHGISDEQFEKILRNNVMANHWLSQLVAPDMIARREGAIIFVSSIGGLRGSPVIGAYNISKAADMQLARNLAVEYGAHNVRVNCIAPGLVRTDFARALWEDPDNLARALRGTPLGRIGEPEDIAGAAVFLASKAGAYVTGQTLIVDGGATVTVGGI
jgi:NAD(P)-dependent dehydrogenase (short-subunit alcohol dehydrogenase family)